MRPSRCWAWARTAAERGTARPSGPWGTQPGHLLPAGGVTPHRRPAVGMGRLPPPLLVAPAQGSWLAGLGAARVGSVRRGRAVGTDEIKVPAMSQRLLRGRVVQGALMRPGRRRGWDGVHGAGSACRQGKGPRLWCCAWGRKSPQERGSPGDVSQGFPHFGRAPAARGAGSKVTRWGLLLEPISSK